MQKARSGLAAAAAKMQLVDAPEGESSLQSRLNEAEKRAQDAETSAQDAQAALARTLLEAARVEAVVTARIKAESEAEREALRRELDCMRQATSTLEATLQPDMTPPEPAPPVAADTDVAPAPEDAAPALETATETPPDLGVEATGSDAGSDDGTPEPAQETEDLPSPRIQEDVRADRARPEMPDVEAPVAASAMMRFLPPMRVAFLMVVAVVAVVSYLVASSFMEAQRDRARVAMASGLAMPGEAVADGSMLQGTGTDPASIAEASAALDAELARLQALRHKVESLRTVLADRRGANAPRAAAGGERMRAADRAPAGANWLLYMPVEREALVHYLAGRSWPGIQMAAQRR